MISLAEHYERPDLDAVAAEARRLADACAAAPNADACVAVLREWNALRATVDTQFNLAMVLYHVDTRDETARAEQRFWDEAAPLLRELGVLYARAVVDSPHRGAIEAAFGAQLVTLKTCDQATFAPSMRDALAEEARLVSRYTEVMAKKEAPFRGESLTLSQLARHFTDADRTVRADAEAGRDAFLAANAGELDEIFDRMVTLRDQMGRALGEDGYLPLGYKLMHRSDYGPAEVARFRDAIRDEIVPITTALHAGKARALGVDRLLVHDEAVWDRSGNPRPIGDTAFILERGHQMYRELGQETGAFFASLVERGLLDVDARDGKAGGGFCTNFTDLQAPFVFANFNGSDGDIMVITHECGHAFQIHACRELVPPAEYAFPTMDAAEICSFGMEYLTYPWMELFFGDDAARYRRTHLARAICMLPYTALVDHFQHEVYENPDMTPAERHAYWLRLEQVYMPHRDYGDGLYPYTERGGFWQKQLHIYSVPLYYIDYALAKVAALQLWQRAAADRAAAVESYMAMARVGGSASFGEILELGGLRSPFDPACIREVAAHVRHALDAPDTDPLHIS